jgi:hypothetical protein
MSSGEPSDEVTIPPEVMDAGGGDWAAVIPRTHLFDKVLVVTRQIGH